MSTNLNENVNSVDPDPKPVKKVYLPPSRRNPQPESLSNDKTTGNFNKNGGFVQRRQFFGSSNDSSATYNRTDRFNNFGDRTNSVFGSRNYSNSNLNSGTFSSSSNYGGSTMVNRTIPLYNDDKSSFNNSNERSFQMSSGNERTIPLSSVSSASSNRYGRPYTSPKPPTSWAVRGDRRYYEEKESEVFEPLKSRMSTGINFNSYDNIPVQMTGHGSVNIKPIEDFEASVHTMLIPNIKKVNYNKPTPIQRHSIPVILEGRDLMACAQTGSGKTAAFLLPIVTSMLKTGPPKQPQLGHMYYPRIALPVCLVLSPTRELAVQIYSESRKFNFGTGIRTVVLYGGSEVKRQLIELERGCDICVATPGRLTDLVERRRILFSCIKYLVLDEADRMLDMGFAPQIRAIVGHSSMPRNPKEAGDSFRNDNLRSSSVNKEFSKDNSNLRNENNLRNDFTNVSNVGNVSNLSNASNPTNVSNEMDNYEKDFDKNGVEKSSTDNFRQTVMFSATFPKEIQQLAKEFLNNYIYLAVGRVGSTNEFIKQRLLYADQDQKVRYLVKLLKENTTLGGLVLIFVETKKRADLIEGYLLKENFKAVNIHGDRSQEDREKALSLFKAGVRPILVATDVAARGLDISNITHVINCDLPTNIDDYVHRIGRTGRAGNIGIATSLVNESNRPILKDLLLLLQESNQEIPVWFKKLVSTVTGSSTGNLKRVTSKNKFSSNAGFSRDIRNDTDVTVYNYSKGKSYHTSTNTFQEFEDDWW